MWRFIQQKSSPRRTPRHLELDILEDRAVPATLIVNTVADNTAADSTLTLREAIQLVNKNGNAVAALGRNLTTAERAQVSGTFGSADIVSFNSSLSDQTLRMNGTQFNITRSVIISTANVVRFAIDAGFASRHFNINDGTASKINVSFISGSWPLAIRGGSVTGGGGAIANAENLTIDGAIIHNNGATFGGGIYNTGTLTLQNATTIERNGAAQGNGGGGVYNAGTVFINTAFFVENVATYGGGLNNYGGTATLTNGGFRGNSTNGIDGGGAILNSGQLNIYGTGFANNSANNGYGGAIHSLAGIVTIQSSSGAAYGFRANFALAGGALFNDTASTMSILTGGTMNLNFVSEGNGGGAVYNRGNFSATGVIFEQNSATYGGAFYNAGGIARLSNCTFAVNSATDAGGAINNTATMTLDNVTIDYNTAKSNGGGIANYGNLTVTNSRIRNNRADSDGDGSGQGGGIFSTTTVYIRANTISGNIVGTGVTPSDLFGGPFVNF